MHNPYNLYKRPTTKKNRYIFYVKFYDPEGNRLTAMSSGQTSRAAAEVWAHEQLKKGIITTEKNITFGKYAEDWSVTASVKEDRRRGSLQGCTLSSRIRMLRMTCY